MPNFPSSNYLVRLMDRVEWVMLQVPSTIIALEADEKQDVLHEEKAVLIAEISSRLSEHKVWDCNYTLTVPVPYGPGRIAVGTRLPGISQIGIRRVITEREIIENLDLFISAITRYGKLATSLMTCLATHLGIELSVFSASEIHHPYSRGQLPTSPDFTEEWAYFFHGVDCAFTSRGGITIEARLGFGAECGNEFCVIEPGFFLWYLQSDSIQNAESAQLVELLCGWFENAARTIDYRERNALMRHVSAAHDIGRGWILNQSKYRERKNDDSSI